MSSICWVVKNCAGIRRNLPGPARCFLCVFQGSSADGLAGIAPCFHPAHQRRSRNSAVATFFLRSFFLRSSFSRPARRGKRRIAGSPRSSIPPVSPWLEPREAPELSHTIRTHHAERQHRPVPLHQPSLRILSPSCQRRRLRVQLARPRTARDSLPIPPPHQPRHSQRPLWFQLLSQVTCGNTGLHTSQNFRVASK